MGIKLSENCNSKIIREKILEDEHRCNMCKKNDKNVKSTEYKSDQFEEIKEEISELKENKCFVCGNYASRGDHTIEHIIDKGICNKREYELRVCSLNFTYCCQTCNNSKRKGITLDRKFDFKEIYNYHIDNDDKSYYNFGKKMIIYPLKYEVISIYQGDKKLEKYEKISEEKIITDFFGQLDMIKNKNYQNDIKKSLECIHKNEYKEFYNYFNSKKELKNLITEENINDFLATFYRREKQILKSIENKLRGYKYGV